MKRSHQLIGACALVALAAFLFCSSGPAWRRSISTNGSLVVVTQANSVTFVARPANDAVFIVKSATVSTNSSAAATNAVSE